MVAYPLIQDDYDLYDLIFLRFVLRVGWLPQKKVLARHNILTYYDILSDLKLWLRIFIPPKVPDWRVAARTCDCCTRD